MDVSSYLLPTQYVVLKIAEPEGGWGDAVEAIASATDPVNVEPFAASADLVAGSAAVLRIGPFRAGGSPVITVSTIDNAEAVVDTEDVTVEVAQVWSPGVVIRQAVYDILEAANLNGELLTDGLRRPASAAEDMEFTGGQVAIEVGSASTQKAKKSGIRSEVRSVLHLTVYTFGEFLGDAFNLCDNTAWAIQRAVDNRSNLGLGNLSVNNYAWSWDVREPEPVDVQGSPIPVAAQELTLTVLGTHVGAPST
jgi:hypothetical protein